MKPVIDLAACPPLVQSSHAGDGKVCVWEWFNLQLTGELTNACPPCTHPALYKLIMRANDTLGDADRQRLPAYALRALGSAERDSAEIACVCADVEVREFAPAALDAAGLHEQAARLRALPPITSAATAYAARAAAVDAAADARAARSGARSGVARGATYAYAAYAADAARAAARAAAHGAANATADTARAAAYAAANAANAANASATASASASASAADLFVLLDRLLPA